MAKPVAKPLATTYRNNASQQPIAKVYSYWATSRMHCTSPSFSVTYLLHVLGILLMHSQSASRVIFGGSDSDLKVLFCHYL